MPIANATRKPPYGQAQADFINSTRSLIKSHGASFFNDKDWRSIKPAGGVNSSLTSKKKLYTDSFYVKAVAAWIPHLLFPNFLPRCPHCCESKHIQLTESRWIDSPIILFGLETHRYLDTMLYYCSKCKKRFTSYNKKAMQLDASQYIGYFNFYLGGKGYAVDEELYSYVINEATTISTATIYERLQQMSADHYLSVYHKYLHAVSAEKIKNTTFEVTAHDPRQRTLHSVLEAVPETTAIDRRIRLLKEELVRLNRQLRDAQVANDGDIWFDKVLELKRSNNVRDPPLKGIGKDKLKQLMQRNVLSAKQLLEVPQNFNIGGKSIAEKLSRWKSIARRDLQKRANDVKHLQDIVDSKSEELALEEFFRDATRDDNPLGNDVAEVEPAGDNDESSSPSVDRPSLPPLLSKMDDSLGFNARVISKYRIDSIVTTEYLHRKQIQEAKMLGLGGIVLKIDFNYTVASKFRIWQGQGTSFCPFKSVVTIQNEDALTLFWKGLKHHESIAELEPDLHRLKNRIIGNNSNLQPGEPPVKVINVDNCCCVQQKLQEVFGEHVQVKLDPFHWLKRWNDALADTTSAEAGIVRMLMSRATFNVDSVEYARARDVLVRKGKHNPTPKEILKEANSTIPDAKTLRSNVEAVVQYLYDEDARTEAKLATMDPTDKSAAHPKKI